MTQPGIFVIINIMLEKDLQGMFDIINELCFEGELPYVELVISNEDSDYAGDTKFQFGSYYKKETGIIEFPIVEGKIIIYPKVLDINDYDTMTVLLHEMVHYYLINKYMLPVLDIAQGKHFKKYNKVIKMMEKKTDHTLEFWKIFHQHEETLFGCN